MDIENGACRPRFLICYQAKVTIACGFDQMSKNTLALSNSISGTLIARELSRLGLTHVITVPDTLQKTLIEALDTLDNLKLIPAATEDEAMAINAGLYISGLKSMLLIQNTGFFASMNTLRAIALDAEVPTLIFVGEFGRDVTKPSSENQVARVRLLEPTLDTWGVPYYRLDNTRDLKLIESAVIQSNEEKGPVVVIVGAPTS